MGGVLTVQLNACQLRLTGGNDRVAQVLGIPFAVLSSSPCRPMELGGLRPTVFLGLLGL